MAAGSHRKKTRAQATFLLLIAIACSLAVPLSAQETPPPGQPSEPAAAEPVAAAPESTAEPPAAECRPPFTAVACSAENVKFVSWFDVTCLIGIPALFLVIWPLLRVRKARKSWRMTSPLYRWSVPACIGVALIVLAILVVPFFPQMTPVPPESGLLKYMGVDPAFMESCDPCRTRVTNRAPFFGWMPVVMPPQGLAPQHPYALSAAVVIALLFWGGLHWVILLWWRRRGGIEAGGAGRGL